MYRPLFYMDDLKLFAKDDINLEEMLQLVKQFSDDIGMAFGLDKCAKVSFKRDKMTRSASLELDIATIIHFWFESIAQVVRNGCH